MKFGSIVLGAAAVNAIVPTIEISPTVHMPLVGLGTWQYNDTVAYGATLAALKMGYTHVDTALGYNNQVGVGKAIIDSGRARDSFFVTSKIPGGLNTSATEDALAQALSTLQLDYVDLMLIHYPASWAGVGGKELRVEEWKALEAWKKAGKARAIGVSHYCQRHMEDILAINTTDIALNQVQYHIGMGPGSPTTSGDQATDYKTWTQQQGITYMSFSTLCGPCQDSELITGKLTNSIGQKYGKSGAQIALAWATQRGIPVVPKTNNPTHLAENLDLFDFVISDEDMQLLDASATPPVAGGPNINDSGDCSVA